MSSSYFEYSTLDELRKGGEGAQLSIASNSADPFLLSLIREVSETINNVCSRHFSPHIETQTYDSYALSAWNMGNQYYSGGRAGDVFQSRTGGYAYGRILRVDNDDLLEITTLTNGDGSVVAPTNFLLYPNNVWPKSEIRLKQSGGIAWLPDSLGNYEQVISISGIFGYHNDYLRAWGGCGTVTDAAGINAAVTTYTASAGAGIKAGMLLKIDTEFLYARAVSGTSITIDRGVNGSTAAAHLLGAPVSYWKAIFTVSKVCRMAAASLWNLRANPEGKQVSINGVTFTTPNSVATWIDKELEQAGLEKTGLG